MQYDEKHHIPIKAKAAGVAIINNQCQILLVHEKIPGKADLWHIPSGSIKANELLEDTALRETKEETGLDVSLVSYMDTYVPKCKP